MCVAVELAAAGGQMWRPEDVVIALPADLTPQQMMILARDVLTELGTHQPESTMEGRCYCGDRLMLCDMPAATDRPPVPAERILLAEVRDGA